MTAPSSAHGTCRSDAEDGCITCGDVAVELTVELVDVDRGLALCSDAAGRRETVEIALVGPVAARRPAARSRRHRDRALGAGGGMKYVDEFRDAELGRALAGEILSLVEPGRHYKLMEVCGGHTHSIYKYGDRRPAARERRAGPRPRLPGLRDPDGPGRRRASRSPASDERDLHLLRRHDARPRLRADVPRREGGRRRHPDGLLAARRPADRQGEPRPRRSSSSRSASRRPRPRPR